MLVGRDLPLLRADGIEADGARAVNDKECWTLPEAHRSVRYVVGVENGVFRVGKDGVRHRMLADVSLDRAGGFGCNRDDGSACIGEPGVIVAQLREMPTAERSGEPSQEDEYDRPASEHTVQVDRLSRLVGKREPRCRASHRCSRAVFRHPRVTLRPPVTHRPVQDHQPCVVRSQHRTRCVTSALA